MNRNKKLLLNTGMGVIQQLVTIICGFILPRFFLKNYGSEVNGLISSMSQFLGFISLLEMGIGPVIQANLYKPLADKDVGRISEIVVSAEKFFRKIAYIFLAYIVVLSILFPMVLATEFDPFFTISLLLIIAISTIAQYFFGATYQVLLNADQKSYVQMSLQTVAVILNAVICIVLMNTGASVHVVKLVSASIFVLRPIGQMIYVKRNYPLNKKITLVGEPIKQKWNGFAQHVSATVATNANVVVLTFLSTLSNVSIYSVYHLVANGVSTIVMTAASGLEPFLGNIIAQDDEKTLKTSFELIEWLVHCCVTVLFTIAAIAIIPFVTFYTNGITDVNYIQPLFGYLLVLAYMMQCLRIPYFRIIKAAGHFKQTQNGSFIMAAINIIVSVVLVSHFGLIGVALGMLCAMAFHTCYSVWYLRKKILNRSVFYFVKHIIADAVVLIVSFMATAWIKLGEPTLANFLFYAVKVGLITLVVAAIINFIFNYKMIALCIKKTIKKKKHN